MPEPSPRRRTLWPAGHPGAVLTASPLALPDFYMALKVASEHCVSPFYVIYCECSRKISTDTSFLSTLGEHLGMLGFDR